MKNTATRKHLGPLTDLTIPARDRDTLAQAGGFSQPESAESVRTPDGLAYEHLAQRKGFTAGTRFDTSVMMDANTDWEKEPSLPLELRIAIPNIERQYGGRVIFVRQMPSGFVPPDAASLKMLRFPSSFDSTFLLLAQKGELQYWGLVCLGALIFLVVVVGIPLVLAYVYDKAEQRGRYLGYKEGEDFRKKNLPEDWKRPAGSSNDDP